MYPTFEFTEGGGFYFGFILRVWARNIHETVLVGFGRQPAMHLHGGRKLFTLSSEQLTQIRERSYVQKTLADGINASIGRVLCVLALIVLSVPLTAFGDNSGHISTSTQSQTSPRGVSSGRGVRQNTSPLSSSTSFDLDEQSTQRAREKWAARESAIRTEWIKRATEISKEYERQEKPLDNQFIRAVEKAVSQKYTDANLADLFVATQQMVGAKVKPDTKLDPFAAQLAKLFGLSEGATPGKKVVPLKPEELREVERLAGQNSDSEKDPKEKPAKDENVDDDPVTGKERAESPIDRGKDILKDLSKEAEKQNPKSEDPTKEDTKLTSGEEVPKDTNPAGVKPSESVLGDNSVLPVTADVPVEGDSVSSGRGVSPGKTPKENGILAKSGYQDFLQDVENLETNAAIAREETEEFVEVDDDGTHGEESFVSADADDDDSGERIADSDDEEDDSVAALKAQADLIREAQAALADPNATTADLSDKLRNLLDFTDGKSIIPDDVLRTIANRPRDTVKIIERTTARDPFAAFIPQGEKKPLIARDGNPFRSALDGAALVGVNGQPLASGERLPSTVSVKKKGEPDFRKFGKPKKKKKDKKLVKKKKKGALAKKSKKPKSLWAKAKEISKSLIQGLWAAIAAKKNLKPLTKEEAVALAKMPRPTTEYTQAALLARLSPQMAGLVVQDGALSVGQVVPAAAGAMLALMLVWMVRAFFRRIVIAVDKRRKA